VCFLYFILHLIWGRWQERDRGERRELEFWGAVFERFCRRSQNKGWTNGTAATPVRDGAPKTRSPRSVPHGRRYKHTYQDPPRGRRKNIDPAVKPRDDKKNHKISLLAAKAEQHQVLQLHSSHRKQVHREF